MITKEIKIEGMSCNHCVKSIEKELAKLNLKVLEVKIGSAKIEYDENIISQNQISEAIDEAGYRLRV